MSGMADRMRCATIIVSIWAVMFLVTVVMFGDVKDPVSDRRRSIKLTWCGMLFGVSAWFRLVTHLLCKLKPKSPSVVLVIMSAAAVLCFVSVANQVLFWGHDVDNKTAIYIATELGWQFSIVLVFFGVVVRPRYSAHLRVTLVALVIYGGAVAILYGGVLHAIVLCSRGFVLALFAVLVLHGSYNAECGDRQQFKDSKATEAQISATNLAEARAEAEQNLMVRKSVHPCYHPNVLCNRPSCVTRFETHSLASQGLWSRSCLRAAPRSPRGVRPLCGARSMSSISSTTCWTRVSSSRGS